MSNFVLRMVRSDLLRSTSARVRSVASQRLERLNAYPWSSYRGYCAAAKAEEFVTYDVLREYGQDLAATRRRYGAYVQACLLEEDRALLEAMAGSRYAIGGTAFIERIEQRRTGRLQDRDVDLPRRSVPLEEIDAAVAKHYGLDPRLLSAHGRRVGAAKAAAVELAAQLADMTGRAIGEHYGIGPSGVTATHRRLASRPQLLQVVETLARKLRK